MSGDRVGRAGLDEKRKHEVAWGFDPDVYRRLAGTAVTAFAAALSIAAAGYGIGFRRMLTRTLETPPDTSRRARALPRAAARLAAAVLARRPGAGLLEGDVVAFEIEGDHVIVRKVARGRDEYLQGLSATVSEWASPEDEDEDEDAWRDL